MGCGGSKKAAAGTASKGLTDPFKLGNLDLQNRMVMSAMTRGRCDPKTNIPTQLNATYYAQRAGFGLILTECAAISARGNGYYGSGALWNDEQQAGWKLVTTQVHKKGGQIFAQIVHCGRVALQMHLNGQQPVAPSAIAVEGKAPGTEQDYPVPVELTVDEITAIVGQFVTAAERAQRAGFDGIELHGANGYLIDQFLRSSTNKRTDKYGGSVQNRARFLLEVVDAVVKVLGPNLVGIKLSPTGRYNSIKDENPLETYTYVLQELSKRKILFVEISREDPEKQLDDQVIEKLHSKFSGNIIANSGFNETSANDFLSKGYCSLVSFAKLAIRNPDLPNRFQNKKPVDEKVDYSTMFVGGEKDYSDFPNAE